METRPHTAPLAYHHAASKMLRSEPYTKEAAIACQRDPSRRCLDVRCGMPKDRGLAPLLA